jgi:hypothetical protein
VGIYCSVYIFSNGGCAVNDVEKAFWHGYERALNDAIFEMEIREHFHEASILRRLMATLIGKRNERTDS